MKTEQHQPALSVIVPVYNGERYLRECLNSICEQTLSDFEVLIVDDGSTDSTREIAEEYAARDARFRVCPHVENRGLFAARLTGVEASMGDYLAFVDADDTVTVDWLRLLLQHATESGSDITAGQFLSAYDDGRLEYFNLDPLRAPLSYEGDAVFAHFIGQEGSCYSWHLVWNKLYTRALWESALSALHRFSEAHPRFVMCEDIAFSVALWLRARRFEVVTDGAYYYYRQHASASTSQSRDRKRVLKNLTDTAEAFAFAAEELEACGQHDAMPHLDAWRESYARLYFSYLREAGGASRREDEATVRALFALNGSENLDENPPESGYFHSVATPVDRKKLNAMESLKRAICSDATDTVSFDLFDTLVLRPFLRPTDLFYLLQEDFERLVGVSSYLLFPELRVAAEAACRLRVRAEHPDWEDVTLDEIYAQMALDYPIGTDALDALKARECELELRFCTPRRIGRELFALARARGKRVIVCSDMYLPQATVEAILTQNGYACDGVYLSSTLRLGKWTGHLYRHVRSALGVPSGRILHIGDNRASDVDNARKSGWQSAHLPSPVALFQNEVPEFFGGGANRALIDGVGGMRDGQNPAWGFFGYRTALAVGVNRLWDSPYAQIAEGSDYDAAPYRMGYFALGQYLYAITDWLAKKATHEERGRVHFVARDGYLPMQAYELLRATDSELPPANYLYISRKALALTDVYAPIDLYSLRGKLLTEATSPRRIDELLASYYKDGITTLCEKMTLDDAAYCRRFADDGEYDRTLRVALDCLDFAKLEVGKTQLKRYFEGIVSPRDLLFDIGYSGRGEAALSRMLGYPVDGAYVHSNTQALAMRARQQGFETDCFYGVKPRITGVIREHVFMKLAPSAVGYRAVGETLEPIFEDARINATTRLFTEILQGAALDYVRDLCTIFGRDREQLFYRREDLAHSFEAYLHGAKPLDRRLFACVIFEDEMGYGKAFSALDFWERDLAACRLGISDLSAYTQDQKLRDTFMPYPRWKKALCYLILDRGHFLDSLKKLFKK